MSNNQLAGFPAFGPRVDSEVIYNPVEFIPGSPLPLPTTAPATAQIQFTINAASLPSYSPVNPSISAPSSLMQTKYTIATITGFKNNAATQQYAAFALKSAKPSTFTGVASVPIGAGKYKTITHIGTMASFDLNDVHEVKLYGGTTEGDISLLWAYMIVIPNYACFMPSGTGVSDLTITASQVSWIGAAAVRTPSAGYSGYKLHLRLPNGNAVDGEVAASMSMSAYAMPNSMSAIMRAPANNTGYGAYDTGDRSTDDKYHFQIYYPTRIAYTPIL